MQGQREQVGLLLLRLGLGILLLLWGIEKILLPGVTNKVFETFYGVGVSPTTATVLGVLEVILAIGIIIGLWKTVTYGLGLVLHIITTIVVYPRLISPFGDNHLFIATIPILGAFIALYLLRDHDRMWAADEAMGV